MRTWRPEPCSVSVALDIPCLVKCKVLLTTLDAWKYVGAPVSECLQPEENGVLIFILKIHLPFFNLSKSMEGALCLWLPFLSNKVAKALYRRSKHNHLGQLTSAYGEAWACWWWYIHIVSTALSVIYTISSLHQSSQYYYTTDITRVYGLSISSWFLLLPVNLISVEDENCCCSILPPSESCSARLCWGSETAFCFLHSPEIQGLEPLPYPSSCDLASVLVCSRTLLGKCKSVTSKMRKKTDGLLLVLPLPPHPLMIQALQMACKVLAKERKEQQKQMRSRTEGQNRSEPNALTTVTNASALSFPLSISKPLCCISALLSSCYTAVVLRQRNSPDPHIVRLTTQFCMSQGTELK